MDPLALPDEPTDISEARLETALMALFRDRRGDAEFSALYEYAREDLARWIQSFLRAQREKRDVSELVQDTFVNVYRYAGGFRDEQPRSFKVWSRTIACNVMRRARNRRSEPSLQAWPEGLQEPADMGADPSQRIVECEDERALTRAWVILLHQYALAFEKLGARDRLALELIEVQELSYAEVCTRLGVRMSNMKMIMFRARRRMRAWMGAALERRGGTQKRAAG